MAGVPKKIINRADKILKQLEGSRGSNSNNINQADDMQLSFFKLDDPILEEIRDDVNNLDINSLTPIEALMKLNQIKKLLGN